MDNGSEILDDRMILLSPLETNSNWEKICCYSGSSLQNVGYSVTGYTEENLCFSYFRYKINKGAQQKTKKMFSSYMSQVV